MGIQGMSSSIARLVDIIPYNELNIRASILSGYDMTKQGVSGDTI